MAIASLAPSHLVFNYCQIMLDNSAVRCYNLWFPAFSVLFCILPSFIMVFIILLYARRAGSDGSMSTSGSAGPELDPQRGSKFSFENFQPRG